MIVSWVLHRHDARRVSEILEPESVDVIVTSPPYFALRSYRDECEACGGDGKYREGVEPGPPPPVNNNGLGPSSIGRNKATAGPYADKAKAVQGDGCPACNGTGRSHYDGQLGSEPTPAEFVDALIACTADWMRVLRPGGSMFINLGDKYAGGNSGQRNTDFNERWGNAPGRRAQERSQLRSLPVPGFPAKSRMGLPWRYAIRCVDELGLILRADIVWSKPNGLPESVTDRVRMSHEYLFHFTKQGRYFAAIDEVREDYAPRTEFVQAPSDARCVETGGVGRQGNQRERSKAEINPLGKVPGSVWVMPSEPLQVPDDLGVDHFAAFPSELPRRCILGWSPSGWCTVCGEARRAVVDTSYRSTIRYDSAHDGKADTGRHANPSWGSSSDPPTTHTITGYACACPTPDAPTRPAVVLDPFCGTGTTVAVAHHLGRHGIGVDLSNDYLKLAEWRCSGDQRLKDKVLDRTGIPNPEPPAIDGQLDLFAEGL